MAQWAEKLDAFLEFNEQELLTHAGKVKAEVAKYTSETRYEEFDQKRKKQEAIEADNEDIKVLEEFERKLNSAVPGQNKGKHRLGDDEQAMRTESGF